MRGSRFVSTAAAALILLAHGRTSSAAASEEEDDDDGIATSPPPSAVKCETEEDLDFSACDLEHLSKEVLQDICSRVGLDLQEHIFPIFDAEIGVNKDDAAGGGERTIEEYVWAAHECLLIENEVDEMEDEDPEGLEALERAMLEEDPQLLAEIIEEVLESNPQLLHDLEEELKREDPAHYQGMIEKLSEGESIMDKPELIADLISLMLAENPAVIDQIDEDIAYEHINKDPDKPRTGNEEL